MKPRKVYRSRPKKTGAKKKIRVLSQKKRLIASGIDEKTLKQKNVVEIRQLLKKSEITKAKVARRLKQAVKLKEKEAVVS